MDEISDRLADRNTWRRPPGQANVMVRIIPLLPHQSVRTTTRTSASRATMRPERSLSAPSPGSMMSVLAACRSAAPRKHHGTQSKQSRNARRDVCSLRRSEHDGHADHDNRSDSAEESGRVGDPPRATVDTLEPATRNVNLVAPGAGDQPALLRSLHRETPTRSRDVHRRPAGGRRPCMPRSVIITSWLYSTDLLYIPLLDVVALRPAASRRQRRRRCTL